MQIFLEAKLKSTSDKARAPAHRRPETRRWFEHVTEEFELEQHHVRLLTLAGEAWDSARKQEKPSNGMASRSRTVSDFQGRGQKSQWSGTKRVGGDDERIGTAL
jgi:ribosome modulation factor